MTSATVKPPIILLFMFFFFTSDRLPSQIYGQLYGKVQTVEKIKLYWASSGQATSFKIGECNLLPSILTLQFTNCVKFNCWKSYLPLDSYTITVNSDRYAFSSSWCQKTLLPLLATTCPCLAKTCSASQISKFKVLTIKLQSLPTHLGMFWCKWS